MSDLALDSSQYLANDSDKEVRTSDLQGSNIRFCCYFPHAEMENLRALDDELFGLLCHQINRFMGLWSGSHVQKLLFSDFLLDGKYVEGILKLSHCIKKKKDKNKNLDDSSYSTSRFVAAFLTNESTLEVILTVKKTEWPRSKTPFDNFLRRYKPSRRVVWIRKCFDGGPSDPSDWKPQELLVDIKSEHGILEYLLQTKLDENAVKEFLLDHLDKGQLLR